MTLAIAAALIGFTLGLFFGLVAGYLRDSWIDKVATSIAIAGVSVPHYWLGMVLVIIFSVSFNWLPAVGAGPGGSSIRGWDWEHIRYLILPAITTSVIPMGIVTRTVRALTGDILSQDFVEALRVRPEPALDQADQQQVREPAGQDTVQRVGAVRPSLGSETPPAPFGSKPSRWCRSVVTSKPEA